MIKRMITTQNPVFLLGLACSILGLSFVAMTVQEETLIEFGYSGVTGPENWGNLSYAFIACSEGEMQSPVNIMKDQVILNGNLTQLARNYRPANATLVKERVYIVVHYDENAGALALNGKNYTLKEMHWHCPSEHQIDGVQYPTELHLVHMASDGDNAVVSILYQYGDADPLVSMLQTAIEELIPCDNCSKVEETQVSLGTVDVEYLRENTSKYYTYSGSLTTPPCNESVIWNVIGEVRTISHEQVATLKAPLEDAFKNNSRPGQALNGRTVELFSHWT